MKKVNKLSLALFSSAIYLILVVIILLCASLARYRGVQLAHTSFGIERFNTVILGDYTDGTVKSFKNYIAMDDCVPGMQLVNTENLFDDNNTCRVIPFSVSNGVSNDNASDVTVDYKITLRSTKNIPLEFKLCAYNESDGTYTFYNSSKVRKLTETVAEGSTTWYEWDFLVSKDAAAVFSLTGGSLEVDMYNLVITWPYIEDKDGEISNDLKYIKEVDILQVVVSASSRNNLNNNNFTKFSYNVEDLYGHGLVILDPGSAREDEEVSGFPMHYSYLMDFRSFKNLNNNEDEHDKFFDFEISNSVPYGITQSSNFTEYIIKLKTPYTSEILDNDTVISNSTMYDNYFLYRLDEDGNTLEVAKSDDVEYRLYNLKYNSNDYHSYRVIDNDELTSENIQKWSLESSQYRLYKVYTFYSQFEGNVGVPFKIANKILNSDGEYEDFAFSNKFRIKLTVLNNSITRNTTFDNKPEIYVYARNVVE